MSKFTVTARLVSEVLVDVEADSLDDIDRDDVFDLIDEGEGDVTHLEYVITDIEEQE